MATFTNFLKLYKPITNEVGWDDNMNTNLDTIDGFVNQFMQIPGFVGAWVNAHAYVIGNVTVDVNTGQFFRCAVANTSAATGTFAADRTARPTLWVLTTSSAQDSATAAAASAAAAANSAASATTQLTNFQNIYYGAFATAPLTDPHGGARTTGDLYFDTTTQLLNVWSGTAWLQVNAAFADAPTTAPTTNVYVRGGDHTWKLGVGSAGGVFTGNVVHTANLGVGIDPSTTQCSNGHTFSSIFASGNTISGNIYFSVTPPINPATGGWRYIQPQGTGGAGGYVLFGQGGLAGANAGLSFVTLETVATNDISVANGIANITPVAQWVSTGQFQLFGNGVAFKPGGGLWADSSDARIKTVVGPYPHGLAELLEMLPKMFTFKGNDNAVAPDGSMGAVLHKDTTTQRIGLIAQDCEPYMPELVTQTSAYIDGVLQNDVRQLDATGVIYALVNAVATLDARLKVLETR